MERCCSCCCMHCALAMQACLQSQGESVSGIVASQDSVAAFPIVAHSDQQGQPLVLSTSLRACRLVPRSPAVLRKPSAGSCCESPRRKPSA